MRINELLHEQVSSNILTLKTHCSDFFVESNGLPLYKTLPETYPDFHRVKVRHAKAKTNFDTSLNIAFESERKEISQRSIFASGKTTINENSFYVFPINGFHFLYNTAITEADENHLNAFDEICEKFGDKKGGKLFAEVLRFSYTPQNLTEGITSGSEIILYGIPYYYAMRVGSAPEYDDVLTSVLDL